MGSHGDKNDGGAWVLVGHTPGDPMASRRNINDSMGSCGNSHATTWVAMPPHGLQLPSRFAVRSDSFQRAPMGSPGSLQISHGIPLCPLFPAAFHGNCHDMPPWVSMAFVIPHGIPWDPFGSHGFPIKSHGVLCQLPWERMSSSLGDSHRSLAEAMRSHGIPWGPMVFCDGNPMASGMTSDSNYRPWLPIAITMGPNETPWGSIDTLRIPMGPQRDHMEFNGVSWEHMGLQGRIPVVCHGVQRDPDGFTRDPAVLQGNPSLHGFHGTLHRVLLKLR